METVILPIIGTLLNLVSAFAPLYIIVSFICIIKKNITVFETVTTIFCFPLSVVYWGKFFIPTLTFPLWFEIAAFVGLILMTISIIKSRNENEKKD